MQINISLIEIKKDKNSLKSRYNQSNSKINKNSVEELKETEDQIRRYATSNS